MPVTYSLIEAKTLSGSVATVTFSAIPQTYADLKLVFSARMSFGGNTVDDVNLLLNGTTTSYSMKRGLGNGTVTASDNGFGTFQTVGQSASSTATTATFGNTEVYIPNYALANNKVFQAVTSSENNATQGYEQMTANIRSNTTAITSIVLDGENSDFLTGSTFYLYGISSS